MVSNSSTWLRINCGNNFENDVVVEFNKCALSAKKCVPQRPDKGPAPGDKNWDPIKGRYPPPPAESVSVAWVVVGDGEAW